MLLNINDPKEFNVANFARLLASKDDSQHRQLRVSNDGFVYLSDVIGNLELDDVKFAFETWIAGNDYCGPKVAADRKYVSDEFEMVKAAWNKDLVGILDVDPRF